MPRHSGSRKALPYEILESSGFGRQTPSVIAALQRSARVKELGVLWRSAIAVRMSFAVFGEQTSSRPLTKSDTGVVDTPACAATFLMVDFLMRQYVYHQPWVVSTGLRRSVLSQIGNVLISPK